VFTLTPGVPAAPPASGLVAAAAHPNPPERWENGISWVPERCATTYQLVPWCADAATFTHSRPGAAYNRPVGYRNADECTTLAGKPDLERARRVAQAQLPYVIARELWLGTGTKADHFTAAEATLTGQTTNAYLASSAATTVPTSSTTALVALGRLEQAALEASGGQPVMLHVPLVVGWQVAAQLFRVGQQDYTAAGNQVVFDPGYPGTGPAGQAAGATVWAYATSPVAVLTADWEFVTDDPSTVDRGSNTRVTWASTVFAALFDPCVHFATEITL
jgi:hypothetical protein